jgi:electron transfer flavoprotein alpha subunit
LADKEVWVFSEKPELLSELIGGAQQLTVSSGARITAVVLGERAEVDRTLSYGALRVLWLGPLKEGYLVDDYVPTLLQHMKANPPSFFMVGATRVGRAVAGRIAAHFDTSALTDVMELQIDGGNVQVRHMIFGGGAVRVDGALGEPVIITAGSGVFQPPEGKEPVGEVEEVAFVEPEIRIRLVERKPRQVAAVNLNAARRVVCAGRGVGRQEDIQLIEELARVLGAEVACTRPLAEGLDWLPRERYIGISGAMIKPDLYLGVGVSGQAQHVIGMSEARLVAAINKDASAPIFSMADYTLEADLYSVVPALIEALRGK